MPPQFERWEADMAVYGSASRPGTTELILSANAGQLATCSTTACVDTNSWNVRRRESGTFCNAESARWSSNLK